MYKLVLSAAIGSGAKSAASVIRRHLSPAVANTSDFIAERASGSYIYSTDGQKHLDMVASLGALSTGHCHPRVVEAIQKQAASLIHSQQNIFAATPQLVGLLDRMMEITPPSLTRFFFANSGSEAVDNAIKIARGHTRRQNIICFENSFHGRTYGAMAVTTCKTYYRQGFAPLMPQVVVAPYPYCLHCKVREAHPDGVSWYKARAPICTSDLASSGWISSQPKPGAYVTSA